MKYKREASKMARDGDALATLSWEWAPAFTWRKARPVDRPVVRLVITSAECAIGWTTEQAVS
jgi:hypothetical protein